MNNKVQRSIHYLIIVITTFFICSSAQADVGIPLLMVLYPPFILAFIPIVLIEGWILTRQLVIKKKQAYICATISNLISTLIGIPLTYIFLVILEYGSFYLYHYLGYGYLIEDLYKTIPGQLLVATVFSPILISGHTWMWLVAFIYLLFVFFLISWFIEYKFSAYFLKGKIEASRDQIKKAVLIGNMWSYLLIFLLVFAWFFRKFL